MDDDNAGYFDDTEILRKLAENLDDYFHLLVRKYENIIFGVARSMLSNPQDAEDITEDTFVQAYHALPKLINAGQDIHFRSWLLEIVKNGCANRRRYEKRLKRPPPPISLDLHDVREHVEDMPYCEGRSPEDEAVQRESYDEQDRKIRRMLSQREYVIIKLYYSEELHDSQIASILNEKTDTTKRARQRALKKLQVRWDKDE